MLLLAALLALVPAPAGTPAESLVQFGASPMMLQLARYAPTVSSPSAIDAESSRLSHVADHGRPARMIPARGLFVRDRTRPLMLLETWCCGYVNAVIVRGRSPSIPTADVGKELSVLGLRIGDPEGHVRAMKGFVLLRRAGRKRLYQMTAKRNADCSAFARVLTVDGKVDQLGVGGAC